MRRQATLRMRVLRRVGHVQQYAVRPHELERHPQGTAVDSRHDDIGQHGMDLTSIATADPDRFEPIVGLEDAIALPQEDRPYKAEGN